MEYTWSEPTDPYCGMNLWGLVRAKDEERKHEEWLKAKEKRSLTLTPKSVEIVKLGLCAKKAAGTNRN